MAPIPGCTLNTHHAPPSLNSAALELHTYAALGTTISHPRPSTRHGACGRALAHDAQFIAGGTDMVLDMQQGHAPVAALVDVTTIEHLSDIWQEEGWVIDSGAAATHAAIEAHPLVRRGMARRWWRAAAWWAGPRCATWAPSAGTSPMRCRRPTAPSASWPWAPRCRLTWTAGYLRCAWQPLVSIYAGPGRNKLADNQLLAAFRFPVVGPRQASAFDRIMRPQGVALPILGVAVAVTWTELPSASSRQPLRLARRGRCSSARPEAERVLTSAPAVDAAVIDLAVAAAQAQAELRTSKHRATKADRHEMVAGSLQRVLGRAVERAQASA